MSESCPERPGWLEHEEELEEYYEGDNGFGGEIETCRHCGQRLLHTLPEWMALEALARSLEDGFGYDDESVEQTISDYLGAVAETDDPAVGEADYHLVNEVRELQGMEA